MADLTNPDSTQDVGGNQVDTRYELVTVYRGRDSATYLLSDFEKLGDKAEPLWVRQWPGENAPFKKMELKDSDAVRFFTDPPISQGEGNDLAKWDLEALKRLTNPPQEGDTT